MSLNLIEENIWKAGAVKISQLFRNRENATCRIAHANRILLVP